MTGPVPRAKPARRPRKRKFSDPGRTWAKRLERYRPGLVPFVIEGLIFALTALDFLGFGLAPGSPSWGAMLKDGTGNMQAPWILGSAFAAIAAVLILITFVGEAVREAFDPKKFTTYQ